MNKYHDFRRRDRNPNPASTARQTQRIDKNSSRTARRHKYSNKRSTVRRRAASGVFRLAYVAHCLVRTRLSPRGYV